MQRMEEPGLDIQSGLRDGSNHYTAAFLSPYAQWHLPVVAQQKGHITQKGDLGNLGPSV